MDSKNETVSDREIAKFMNINLTFSFGMFWVVDEEGEMPDYGDGTVYSPSTNWNQLMPVVEKIESLDYEVDVYKHACEINTEDMIRFEALSKIEATYKAVVEFIRWYNSQPPNTIK